MSILPLSYNYQFHLIAKIISNSWIYGPESLYLCSSASAVLENKVVCEEMKVQSFQSYLKYCFL